MVNKYLAKVYTFISCGAVFLILAIAYSIVPRTGLFGLNTYYTGVLFSVVGLTGIYFVVQFLINDNYNLALSIYDVVFICFTGLLFLSSIWARNPLYACNVGMQWAIFYGVYKVFQHFSYKEKQLQFLVLIFTAGLILSLSIVAFLFFNTADYSVGLGSIFNSDQFNQIKKKFGLHRNSISSHLVLGTGIPLYWLLKSSTRKQIVLSSALLGFLAFVLMISRSRGSLLAFFTILILFYLSDLLLKKLNWKKIICSISIILLSVFVAFILQADESTYASFLNPLYGVNSAQGDGRLQMWDISFQLIGEKPWLGYGAGSWEFEYQKYGTGDLKNHSHSRYFYTHSHNYFIDILFTTGFLGLIGFIFLILFYPFKLIITKIHHRQIRDIDYLVFAGILAFNAVALFYGILYNNINKLQSHPLLLFTFIAILNNKGKITSKKTSMSLPIILSILITSFNINAHKNNSYLYEFNNALKMKDYVASSNALDLLERRKVGFVNRKQSLNEARARLYSKQKNMP